MLSAVEQDHRTTMQILIRELSRVDRPALERHFLALGAADRRLRFGVPLNDFALRGYVARINFERDALFGVTADDLHLIGAAHLGRARGHAELGISVMEGARNRGVGGALLARAHLRARNWGVRALFMHCLTENTAMMRLARSQGMTIISEQGASDAWLALPPAGAATHFADVFEPPAAPLPYPRNH